MTFIEKWQIVPKGDGFHYLDKNHCLVDKAKERNTSLVFDTQKEAQEYIDKCLEKDKYVAEVMAVREFGKDNTCVCCGDVIPEGRQVCLDCEKRSVKNGNTK